MELHKIVRIDDNRATYKGYQVTRGGNVIDPTGNNIERTRKGKLLLNVRINDGGEWEFIKLTVLIYSCFCEENKYFRNLTKVISVKEDSVAFEDLRVVRIRNRKVTVALAEQIRNEYGVYDASYNRKQQCKAAKYPTQRKLAEKYGLSLYTVERIIRGVYTWEEVKGDA